MALVDGVLPPKQLDIYLPNALSLFSEVCPVHFFFFLFSFYGINDVESNGNFSSLAFRYTCLQEEYSQKLVGSSIFLGSLKCFLLKK